MNEEEALEYGLLYDKLQDGKGTLEEQEAWLIRLQELDPRSREDDNMHELESEVQMHRKIQTLREQLGEPLTREKLVALAQSIDYSKTNDYREIQDMDLRSALFAKSVPHPEAAKLLAHIWSSKDMSAEEVVEVALSWKVPELFCLPGSVDATWVEPSVTENKE